MTVDAGAIRLRRLSTADLSDTDLAQIRELLEVAFGPDEDDRFTDDDWQHAVGGLHVVLELDDEIVAHAAVVEREIQVDGRPLRTGYVEAVATAPWRRGHGLGTIVMRDVGSHIADSYELGALGTGSHHFYERLGWLTWQGPSFVRTDAGHRPTPDDDGYIMVLATPTSPTLDVTASISCEFRAGDVW